MVVTIDAPIAPNRVRRKFDSADALAIWSGRSPASDSAVSGMKKHATPSPWANCGHATPAKLMPGSKVQARQMKLPPNARKLSEASQRRSMRCENRPISGDRITGRMPTGAVASPAWKAV